MVEYKHVKFNVHLQKLEWALEQAGPEWQLVKVVPYDAYESVAVFSRTTAGLRESSDTA